VLVALCALYFLYPNARLDFSAFDTRDAESYLALSRSLVTGHGYTRSLDPHYYIPHTTWPPGLPLLLAPVAALAGLPMNLLVVKLGMIAYGVAGIVLAYLYARRVSGSPLVRIGVPLLLGLNPYYWQFSRMTDTEMPTVLWSLLALLLNDLAWSRRALRPASAALLGLVCGFGMLIRGSFFGALFLPLVQVFALRREPIEPRRFLPRYLGYAAGFVLPFLVWHLRNRSIDAHLLGQDGINQLAMILRTHPVDPTSPFRGAAQILRDAFETIEGSVIYQIPQAIIPGLWAAGVWGALDGAAAPVAAFLTLAIVAFSCRTARNLPIIVMYGAMALLNILYAAGGLARLWVPVTCLIAVSLPIAAEMVPWPRPGWLRAAVAGGAMTGLAASLALYVMVHEEHPYRDPNYAALAQIFAQIRAHEGLNGNVLTPSPQAFELYTGFSAPMAVPDIGVDPLYAYVILPSAEWIMQPLAGTVILQNEVWSLVVLDRPMQIADFRRHYECRKSTIAAFAVLSKCPIL
jgi:hypothetical protein